MRYDRVEECKQGIDSDGEMLHTFCDACGGGGEIRTPVEHTEMWAVYDKEGYCIHASDEPLVGVWANAADIEGLKLERPDGEYSELMEKHGYTCRRINVIRKEPNEE